MVTYIPGYEALLAPAAQQITDGVVKLLQPNKDFQEQMRAAVATNPQLLQQLADVEAQSPGLLSGLGFGPLGEQVAQVPESAQSQIQRQNRGRIVKGAERDLDIDEASGDIKLRTLESAAKLLATNAGMDEDAARALIGIPSRTQERVQEAQLTTVEAEAGVAGDVATAKGAAARDTTEALERRKTLLGNAWAELPNIGEVDLRQTAKDFLDNKITDMSTIYAIQSVPETAQVFNMQVQNLQQQRAQDAQALLASQRDTGFDSYARQKAYMMFDTSENAGSVNSWMDYLFNQDTRENMDAILAKPPTERTIQERELVEVHEANTRIQSDASLESVRAFTGAIGSAISHVNSAVKGRDPKDVKPDDAAIVPFISEINQTLESRARITGKAYKAQWGEIPDTNKWGIWRGSDHGLYFTNADGEIVSPAEVLNPVMEPAQDQDQTLISRATADVLALPSGADRAAALDRLREIDSGVYDAVRRNIEKVGREGGR